MGQSLGPAATKCWGPRERGLTLRSSGPPPAWRLAREPVQVIIRFAGQAPTRWRPLSSNVRRHQEHSVPHSSDWVLHAGAASTEPQPAPLEPWVQALAARPRVSIGDLEDCVLIEEVLPSGWQCAVLPEYILPHTLVAVASAPSGEYAMLFLTKTSAEFRRQERPTKRGLLGWFHVRLSEPITDESSLAASLQRAFRLLQTHGVISVNSWPPRQ